MAELTAAPGGMQVVTPAPRPLWRRLLDADTDALADHGPEWIDAMCDDGRYVDASRLYELPDGRRFVLPLTRRRGMAGVGGWLACHRRRGVSAGWSGLARMLGLSRRCWRTCAWLVRPGRGFGRIRCKARTGRLLPASPAQWSCHAGPMSST